MLMTHISDASDRELSLKEGRIWRNRLKHVHSSNPLPEALAHGLGKVRRMAVTTYFIGVLMESIVLSGCGLNAV